MSKHEPRGIRVIKRKVANLGTAAITWHQLLQTIVTPTIRDTIMSLQQQQFDKAAALCQHIISKRKPPNE